MKLYLPENSSSYLVDYEGAVIPLTLVTSVAFYKAKLFHKHEKWQVEEDAVFLKNLITSSLNIPTKEALDSLIRMEQYYRELKGLIPEDTPEDQSSEIRARRSASRTDLFSNGLQASDSTYNSLTTDMSTIGDLVELKRKQDGRARNASKKKKMP